ncbi:pre-toxin TG domain-containing protein [Peribacillus butanolivorans]|uniref:pre-toxin TG domain-containing protein n=1 Tax=Peribacillus butanolivorans TaxID=421767 RepID=UPI0036DE87D6
MYEKAWDTIKTFTGEFMGYYDSIRASTGVDPVTGRKLSEDERIAAGALYKTACTDSPQRI